MDLQTKMVEIRNEQRKRIHMIEHWNKFNGLCSQFQSFEIKVLALLL